MASAALVVASTGCEESRTSRVGRRGAELYFQGNYDDSIRTLIPVAETKDENYVLNNLRLGSAALAAYDLNEAERAFVLAYDELNATNVNDAGRSFAAAAFNEKVRIWRGEPYERAMANLYLGMIYYARQDYGNARGAFENALFKLRAYKDDKAQQFDEQDSDFAVALLMLGRCWMKLGREDQATMYFHRAESLRPDLRDTVSVMRNPRANVILFVEFGFGPHKVNAGMDGAGIAFVPGPAEAGAIPPPAVLVDGRRYSVPQTPLFDTVVMAQDHRWQSIDTIRMTKSVVGTGLLAGGALTTAYGLDRRDEGAALVGLGLMLAGAAMKASSEADTRQWEMVPRGVFVIPLQLTPGQHEITVDFPDAGHLQQTWRGLVAPSGDGEATYFYRMLRWRPGPFEWPPVPRPPDVGPPLR
ncbi:MAG: hypothetical protein QM770_04210 [Tepidisphaeraceae bacterium]